MEVLFHDELTSVKNLVKENERLMRENVMLRQKMTKAESLLAGWLQQQRLKMNFIRLNDMNGITLANEIPLSSRRRVQQVAEMVE
jgi:hypothetical protein